MKKCLVIVNSLSGNYRSSDAALLRAKFDSDYSVTTLTIPCDNVCVTPGDYDLIVISGGDGTLNHLINENITGNTEVRYYPSGTLNEAADRKKRNCRTISLVGDADGVLFSYVLAAGTFTPLGYVVDSDKKQKFKSLAYVARVVREYKVNHIEATLDIDGASEKSVYTLIMAINSPRCFGFRFNRLYKEEGPMCLLAIKSPLSKGLLGKIAIFFPFFRAFFMGFSKPYRSSHVTFVPFEDLTLDMPEPPTFCADGEALTLPSHVRVTSHRLPYKIRVCKR